MKLRNFLLIFVVILGLFVVGCSNDANSEDIQVDEADTNADTEAETEEVADISYPEQPIELMVPANPGGATDASARIMAEHIQKYLGENVVVINEAGGGGTIAFEDVRTA